MPFAIFFYSLYCLVKIFVWNCEAKASITVCATSFVQIQTVDSGSISGLETVIGVVCRIGNGGECTSSGSLPSLLGLHWMEREVHKRTGVNESMEDKEGDREEIHNLSPGAADGAKPVVDLLFAGFGLQWEVWSLAVRVVAELIMMGAGTAAAAAMIIME